MGEAIKGRGAVSNIQGRFDSVDRLVDREYLEHTKDEEAPRLQTVVRIHQSKSIITRNDSPDIPFEQSINPYLGCEHGCVYCYARPSHSYIGLSPGLDFETKLFAKKNAAELLRKELSAPKYVCKAITIGANTDPYQPIEREYRITRSVIETLLEFNHPFTIITKNALIERDIDLLKQSASKRLFKAFVSVTSLDNDISRTLEPRASAPFRRIEAIRALAAAGIPVGVLVAPIIPALTDVFLERILEAASEAGASSAGYVLLRLPHEVLPLFTEWLEAHAPLKRDHVLSLMKQMHGGKEYESEWGVRQRGRGVMADLISARFKAGAKKFGLDRQLSSLDSSLFNPSVQSRQASLF